jgi:hypothetical protein
MFPKSLKDNEIIFAKTQITSRSPKKTEIVISKAFTRIKRGISIKIGSFPLSKGI